MLLKGKVVEDRVGLTRYMVPHPSFRAFMRNLSLTALAVFGAFTLIAWWYHRGLLEALNAYGALADEGLRAVLIEHVRKSILISAIAIGGSCFAFLFFSAYALHRICGPVYRLNRHMGEIMNGTEVTELRFRRGDAFEDVRQTFNRFLRHMGLSQGAMEPQEPAAAEAAAPRVTGETRQATR